MWAYRHRSRWQDLDRLREPQDLSQLLDQGGFILADPFDTRLRQLSEDYLHAAWVRLLGVLGQTQVVPPEDISWGSLHPGVATISRVVLAAPGDFVGWTSPRLGDFDRDSRFEWVNEQLMGGSPVLRYGASYRSHKWRIAPDDAKRALRLVEALSTDEVTEWAPAVVLEHKAETGPWLDLAHAILAENQQEVDRAVAEAKAAYSPVGYRIVVRGYRAYLTQPGIESNIRLPDEPA